MRFEWNPSKNHSNVVKHGVSFEQAQTAFDDPDAIVALDAAHSSKQELRWWLLGKVEGKVLTVRYTHRPTGVIRIFGAAWWREGKKRYEEANDQT
jgi:uncharacterized DUF497 family protein